MEAVLVLNSKGALLSLIATDFEDIKWFEFFHTQLLQGNALITNNKMTQDLYNEISSIQFTIQGSLLQNQHQQPSLQAVSINNKHSQRIPSSFGKFS